MPTASTAGRWSTPRTGTVLPGLIESHTHLSKAFGEAQGRAWLAFGITTVRNPATNAFRGPRRSARQSSRAPASARA